jgi:hypothetical protein
VRTIEVWRAYPVVELAADVDAVLEDEARRSDAARHRPPPGANEAGEAAQETARAREGAVVRLHVASKLDTRTTERTQACSGGGNGASQPKRR